MCLSLLSLTRISRALLVSGTYPDVVHCTLPTVFLITVFAAARRLLLAKLS